MDDIISGGTSKYQLNLIYLLDTSGSMTGERINQLNVAMSEAVQIAEETAREMEVQLFMRVVEFNSTARWLFGDKQYGVEHIDWAPLSAAGGTDTAGAIDMACGVMHREFLGIRNYRPVVILITDGESNDPVATVAAAERLRTSLKSTKTPNADKITRIAIGVEDANQTELTSFASVGDIKRGEDLEEDVPFIFNIDELDLLKSLLKSVTVSSIVSSVGAGAGGADDGKVELLIKEGSSDWEE